MRLRNWHGHEAFRLQHTGIRRLSGELLLQRPRRSARHFDSDGAAASRAAISAQPDPHPAGERSLWGILFLRHQRIPDLHTVPAGRAQNRENRSLEILWSSRPALAAAVLRGIVVAGGDGLRVETIHSRKSGNVPGETACLSLLLQQLAGPCDPGAFFLRVVV